MLGGGDFIPGFEEGLDRRQGWRRAQIEATFPEDYPEPTLAGKQARFAVKIKEVASKTEPWSTTNSPRVSGLRVARAAARDGEAAPGAGSGRLPRA